MEYSLSNSLVGGGGGLNLDKLSLDLPFAITKSLTAAKGPTPDFVRASSGTYFGSDGYLKTAGNNVARFDHETSYVGSTVFVQCIDCADVNDIVFSASERIPLSGMDGYGYPYFIGSLFVISYDHINSWWGISYDGGLWEATSTVGLSDEYVPLFNPTVGSNNVTAELACKGLLIEEQSANLLSYSEDFNNSFWTASQVSIAINTSTSPNGTVSSDTMTGLSGSNFKAVFAGGLTNSGTNTFSIYVKSSTQRFFQISRSGNATDYANFDIQSTLATAYGVSTASITNAGNGWYRCTATFPSLSNTSMFFSYADSLAFARQGVTTSTNASFIWGAQLEAKAFPTSYIPTTTGSAPRSADLCSITGPEFTSFYNQPEGTILSSSSMPVIPSANSLAYAFDDTSENERHNFRHNTTFQVTQVGGATQAQFSGTAPTAGSVTKFSVAYKVADYAATKNGTLLTASSGSFTFVPTTTQVYIGSKRGTSEFLNGHIQYIKVFKKRLPNAKLQSLTT